MGEPRRTCLGGREDANLLRRGAGTSQEQLYLSRKRGKRLRGNWSVLAVVLAPILLAASLCLLPDALNLQFRVAQTFEQPGSGQNITYVQPAQTPMTPDKRAPLTEPQPYSPWITTGCILIFALLTALVALITLCSLKRIQAGTRKTGVVGEAIEVYRRVDTARAGDSCG